ncbi:Gfo/Idh/MocA family oxidoreductase [Plantactinospora sp. B6F1]|uniref:Gfo/Idh/MocA family protein n=1 Tax=Plantactinospora sp. B6F1 TaxID=3158971 RepID=UPI0032D99C7B
MTGEVRLAVLGCADVAARRILPAVASVPGVRLIAVASRDRGRADAFAARFGGEPVHGYRSLLDRDDVDAVYLPLPPALHAEWIAEAVHAGKHVLAEKPLTTSAADTARLAELAARHGVVLMENFMFPWHGQHRAVRRLIDEGAIGDLQSFAATFAIPARPRHDIRYRAALGGGALLDVAGYPVRAALHFLGGGLEVRGAVLRHDRDLGVDVGGAALLAAPSGVTAELSFGLRHAYTSGYRFTGSTGRLSVEHVFTPPADHRPVLRLVTGDGAEERTLPPDDQYSRAIEAFVAAVRGGPAPDIEVTVEQARLIDRVRALADEGRASRCGRAIR